MSLEAWPGSGPLIWCLLDKQAPGPGGAVGACGSGDAPARFLMLFLYTHKHTHTRIHTNTATHTYTHFPRRDVFACTERQMLDEPWTSTKHKQTQRRAGAQGSLGAEGGMWQTVGALKYWSGLGGVGGACAFGCGLTRFLMLFLGTHKHTHPLVHIHSHVYTHIHTPAPGLIYIHTHICISTHNTRALTHTHTHTLTHPHTYAHTHMYTSIHTTSTECAEVAQDIQLARVAMCMVKMQGLNIAVSRCSRGAHAWEIWQNPGCGEVKEHIRGCSCYLIDVAFITS